MKRANEEIYRSGQTNSMPNIDPIWGRNEFLHSKRGLAHTGIMPGGA